MREAAVALATQFATLASAVVRDIGASLSRLQQKKKHLFQISRTALDI